MVITLVLRFSSEFAVTVPPQVKLVPSNVKFAEPAALLPLSLYTT